MSDSEEDIVDIKEQVSDQESESDSDDIEPLKDDDDNDNDDNTELDNNDNNDDGEVELIPDGTDDTVKEPKKKAVKKTVKTVKKVAKIHKNKPVVITRENTPSFTMSELRELCPKLVNMSKSDEKTLFNNCVYKKRDGFIESTTTEYMRLMYQNCCSNVVVLDNEFRDGNFKEEKLNEDKLISLREYPPKTEKSTKMCPVCKEYNVNYIQLQTRSADEPMTVFYTCVSGKYITTKEGKKVICEKKWSE